MSDLDDSMGIKYAVLGLIPFVLVEIKGVEEEGEELELSVVVEFGGGLNRETGIELLEMALQELKEQQV